MLDGLAHWLGDVVVAVLEHAIQATRSTGVLFLGLGVVAGFVSLALFPEPLIGSLEEALRVGVLPVVLVGALALGFRRVRPWKWRLRFHGKRFTAGLCVTLGLAVTRLGWFLT